MYEITTPSIKLIVDILTSSMLNQIYHTEYSIDDPKVSQNGKTINDVVGGGRRENEFVFAHFQVKNEFHHYIPAADHKRA